MNNLDPKNVQDSAKKLAEKLPAECLRWFCATVLCKRAGAVSKKPQQKVSEQQCLLILVDHMRPAFPDIDQILLESTFATVRSKIENDRAILHSSAQDRSYLKSLGSWLGAQTIAKDRPVLAREIDFKELIKYSYKRGHAYNLVIIPFILKVLSGCTSSRIFGPSNPYIRGILVMLKEFSKLTDKPSVNFDIAAFFSSLGVSHKEHPSSDILVHIPVVEASAGLFFLFVSHLNLLTYSEGLQFQKVPLLSMPRMFPDISDLESLMRYMKLVDSIAVFQLVCCLFACQRVANAYTCVLA